MKLITSQSYDILGVTHNYRQFYKLQRVLSSEPLPENTLKNNNLEILPLKFQGIDYGHLLSFANCIWITQPLSLTTHENIDNCG